MDRTSRIWVAGHTGLVGSAIVRALERAGYGNLLLRTSSEVDLTDRDAVDRLVEAEQPEYVILAAAKVGGILANNTYPADFIRINLQIQTNVIDASHRAGVKRLLFLGSSCIYPKRAPQPIREEHLLTGPLEETNDAYAIAKIAGVTMCRSYKRQYGFDAVCLMPTNLYGPGDNFDLKTSHVLPALIRKFHEARTRNAPEVELWGTGTPKREFLHVDDLADAALFVMNQPVEAIEQHGYLGMFNAGVGEDLSIAELAGLIKDVVGFNGGLRYDTSKPDGTPRKLLDVNRLKALGWQAKISLWDGVSQTYDWFREHATD